MGYSVQHNHLEDLHKVNYGGSRIIKASTVAAMLDGDDAARLKVGPGRSRKEGNRMAL